MHDDLPATLIDGRYRLGELLGVGGSASVFAADDLSQASSRVAIKMLHPHLCETEASRDAFLREARQAQTLRHPNIVAVRAYGLHDSGGVTMAWIALDLVDGESVGELVAANGRLDVTDAATVLDGVLAGLAVAHAAGLVHRDISPANVLISAHDGPLLASHVLLVDFGLADVTGRTAIGRDVLLAESVGDSVTDAAATDIGVIGNAAFMSPEQAQGKPVRAAGDLYQAGALLYFLLTGRVPYPRDTTAQVLEAHVSAPPPVPSVLAPAARPLDRVVTRAMTKTPARRFRHAAEFRAAIAAAVEGLAVAPALGAPSASASASDAPFTTDSSTRVLESATTGQLAYLSPAPSPSAGETAAQSERATTSAGGFAALVAVVLIAGLAVWGVVSASASPEPATPTVAATVSTPSPTATPPVEEAQPTASAPPLVDPVVVETSVPTLYGTIADAQQSLSALGLVLGTVSSIESAEKSDRVLGQNPQPGQSVPAGSAVDVTVASGTNTVPAVAQLSVGAARALLESAGFVVDVVGTVSPMATVSGTQPAQGAVLRVGVGVVLLVDETEAPVEPTPAPTADTP